MEPDYSLAGIWETKRPGWRGHSQALRSGCAGTDIVRGLVIHTYQFRPWTKESTIWPIRTPLIALG